MTARLPDVARHHTNALLTPLDWVGMEGIDLPIRWAEADLQGPSHARFDLMVNLPRKDLKGIHMSRLYGLVDALSALPAASPATLTDLLDQAIASHADCDTSAAQLVCRFDALIRRPALLTPALGGWRSYPVEIQASTSPIGTQLSMSLTVTYSSTCPCSAALSRQLLAQAFQEQFSALDQMDVKQAAHWLETHGSLATPHSQRSLATVQWAVPHTAPTLGLVHWIDLIESALATPVQTAVKRADEQAFARLNGSNLMYVEDAARRLQQAVRLAGADQHAQIRVQHLESLHPHDAVAYAST